MHERFKLLWSTAGRHNRQATLRAAFDWSWELLSEPEKAALAQLSVFEGGFTLESAEAVVDLSAVPGAVWTVDVIHWLVGKSFVRPVRHERFDLLESVREYAGEHLRTEGRYTGSGPQAGLEAEARHWQFFAALGERAAVAHGCVEANNLVVACRRAVAGSDSHSAIGAIVGAWAALRLTGPFRVGADLAARLGAMPELSPAHRAVVTRISGDALELLGEVAAAHEQFDAGLAWVAMSGDTRAEAGLRIAIGTQCANESRFVEAIQNLERAQALAYALGDRSLHCLARNCLGRVADNQGKLTEAREHYDCALALASEAGDLRMQGGVLANLGVLLHDHGQLEEARSYYERSLALLVEVGDRRWEGNARCNLGLLHHEQGRGSDAQLEFETALRVARELGHVRLELTVLCNLGIVWEAQGDFSNAIAHYEKALSGAHELSDRRSEGQYSGYLGALYARLGQIEDARRWLSSGEALLVEVSDRLSLALLLCQRVQTEQQADDMDAARSALKRVEQLAAIVKAGPDSELGRRLAALRTIV
jgi:tetratricopeptide (TPR) repeat protein